MQAVIFIGIQGSGKSTLFEQRFATTHLRISRDIAGTPARELRLLEGCIKQRLDFVVDNTNPTVESRKRFIEPARAAGYEVVGYFFKADIKECLERNARRIGKAKVPVPGIYRVRKMMQPPTFAEGFHQLFEVAMCDGDVVCREIPQPAAS